MRLTSSCWLLRRQSPQRFPAELHSLLFERTLAYNRLVFSPM